MMVNAAIAAGVLGDEDRHTRDLESAAALRRDHPRVVLEQSAKIDDPAKQLEQLRDLVMGTPTHQALLEAHRALAYMLLDDVEAAERHAAAAREANIDLPPVRMINANVIVFRARHATLAGEPVNVVALDHARSECLAVREHFLTQRRWTEAERTLMLAIDAATLAGDPDEAARLVAQATPEERRVDHGDYALAEAALRAMLWLEAIAFLAPNDRSPTARRVRARATAHLPSASAQERLEAARELEDLLNVEENRENEMAAFARLVLTLTDESLGWHNEAERILLDNGHRDALLGVKANHLARRGKIDEALALVEPHSEQLWALEAIFQVIATGDDQEREADIAEDLLAAGPDPGLRLQCAVTFLKPEVKNATRARAELLNVARDEMAPRRHRAEAYRLLTQIALHEENKPREAQEHINAWIKVNAADAALAALQPIVGSRLKQAG
jgi:hypothetical protein